MKAVIRREGTICGTWCYVDLHDGLSPFSRARVFESYTKAGQWVDEHEGDFVIEPARTP